MATNFLTVPIRIEGLFLDSPKQVTSPLADFSKLPWTDSNGDINFSQPFVGDGIIHEPFGDENLLLEAGVHLHFIVPHYLGQQVPKKSGLTNTGNLPAAPNRWLITKFNNGALDKQWIIESDYVHSVYVNNKIYEPASASSVIPFNQGPPYRYMGRKSVITDARVPGDTFKSLSGKPLTVVGYGDINFSSFYPNCLTVFGFHDELASLNDQSTYTVLGWNNDVDDDLLNNMLSTLYLKNGGVSLDEINVQLANLFKINIDDKSNLLSSNNLPRTLFYGEFNLDKQTQSTHLPSNIEIAVGNTGTEALSALIANTLSNGDTTTSTLVEEQLESVLMHAQLEHLLTDLGPKFLEARHDKGFRMVSSGYLWKIVQRPEDAASTGSEVELPADLAPLLAALNLAQENYDRANHELADLKEQLYADWYKYMHTRYPASDSRGAFPDADHIMFFIQNQSFAEIDDKVASTGKVTYGNADSGFCPTPNPSDTNNSDFAHTLYACWNALYTALVTENATRASNNQKPLELLLATAPNFWSASPPVIVFSGIENGHVKELTPTDGILSIQTITSNQSLNEAAISTLNVGDVLQQLKGTNTYSLSIQKLNPFILDWEVDFNHARMHNSDNSIDTESIVNNFQIDKYGPDFIKTQTYASCKLSVFSGSVLLSSHAGNAILRQIQTFFKNYFKKHRVTFAASNDLTTFLNADNWNDAYKQLVLSTTPSITNDQDFTTNPIYTIWSAYQTLLPLNVLTQTLSGFNEALIMKKKVTQLPIQEPIGFEYAKLFTSDVKQRVGSYNLASPIITAFDFNPIRTGSMSLNRLALIDNFGYVHTIKDPIPVKAIASSLNNGNVPFLNPRLAQPARLNFRWISATGDMEMNSHPESTPICGWLMANYLDNTVAVFDTMGNALGYIDDNATWNIPPWNDGENDVDTNITNVYLQRVVKQLLSDTNNNSNSFFEAFLTATENAQNNIASPNTPLYDTKAVLMGRPMAVVRAQVSFQVKGLAAIDQHWSSLLIDLNNADGNAWTYDNRNNANWTQIKLPIRLGEHSQLNDGLIGYWTENADGTLIPKFIAPETNSDALSNTNIDTFTRVNFQTLHLSLADKPLYVSMLIDPAANIHATSGILPVKSINIPPEHYVSALRKIALWFDIHYLIQPNELSGDHVSLNLPAITGYEWKWWDGFFGLQTIKKDNKQHTNTSAQGRDGWLILSPSNLNNNK